MNKWTVPVDNLGIWTCGGPWSVSPGGSSAQRVFHTSGTWTCAQLWCEFPVPPWLPKLPCTSCIWTCAQLFCALQGTFHCCTWSCSLCIFADVSPCGVTSRSLTRFFIYFVILKVFSDKPGNLLAADWAFLSFNADNFHCRLEKDKLELLVLSKLICLKSPSQWLLWQPITPKYYFCKTFQKNMLQTTLISILLGSSTLFFFPCMLTAWFSKASLGGN